MASPKIDTSPTQGVVTEIKVNAMDVTIVCCSCGCENAGFVADPRGQANTCDQCGAEFRIAEDAAITFW